MFKVFWRFKARIDRLVYDDRSAGKVRLYFFTFLTLSLILLGYYLFEDTDTSTWALSWREQYKFFFWVPILPLRVVNFLVYGFRHMIIPVAVFMGMLFASADYVQDVYELSKFRLGLKYIQAAILGIGYPQLTISEGKKKIPKGEDNLINTIGGPGFVNISPGNVVLFESLRSPSSVRANTVNFISRFETIKEIVSLEDQHGFIEDVGAKTKDGIEVVVRDIHFRYRLRTGRRFGDHERRRALNPYPYSVQAVKDMAYNRAVSGEGVSSWHTAVGGAINGGITNFIKSNKFDDLTAPNKVDSDPRAEITKAMNRQIRLSLRGVGAELLWFDVGHFGVSDRMKRAIEEQRVDTWSARWDGDAMVVRSHGEARRLAYQDMGRAEGEADMIMSIIQAISEADFETGIGEVSGSQKYQQNLRAIVWTKVAQILDASVDNKEEG